MSYDAWLRTYLSLPESDVFPDVLRRRRLPELIELNIVGRFLRLASESLRSRRAMSDSQVVGSVAGRVAGEP